MAFCNLKDNDLARAYLKFTRKGTFKHVGGVAVDVEDGSNLKDIWAAAHELLFAEYIVREREYEGDEWSFELMSVEEEDTSAEQAND